MEGFSFSIDRNAIQLVWDGDLKRPIGTSFSFLRPDWVVTAKHVVIESGFPRRNILVNFQGTFHDARVYVCHPEIDVAVLRVANPSPCETPLFPSYARFTGRKGLVSAGFAPSLTEKAGTNLTVNVSKVNEFQIERRDRSASNEEVIFFPSACVEPGHSGGPMFGEGGGVVGVIIEAFTKNNVSYGRATSILSLLGALEFRPDWQQRITK
jgi:hypothetical protein